MSLKNIFNENGTKYETIESVPWNLLIAPSSVATFTNFLFQGDTANSAVTATTLNISKLGNIVFLQIVLPQAPQGFNVNATAMNCLISGEALPQGAWPAGGCNLGLQQFASPSQDLTSANDNLGFMNFIINNQGKLVLTFQEGSQLDNDDVVLKCNIIQMTNANAVQGQGFCPANNLGTSIGTFNVINLTYQIQ